VREANGREEPGQKWIDLSGRATSIDQRALPYGVSLLNDGKYGFDCLGSDLRMSLLRSPVYCFHAPARVEPGHDYRYMDQGAQTIRYALLPHASGWQEGGTVREAQALNNPFVGVFQYPHPGRWGPCRVLLSVDPPNVVVGALKAAEDGDALILRLFESHGTAAEATVRLAGTPPFQVALRPWELKTLRLERRGEIQEVSLLEE